VALELTAAGVAALLDIKAYVCDSETREKLSF
jgi:hypothetical protein